MRITWRLKAVFLAAITVAVTLPSTAAAAPIVSFDAGTGVLTVDANQSSSITGFGFYVKESTNASGISPWGEAPVAGIDPDLVTSVHLVSEGDINLAADYLLSEHNSHGLIPWTVTTPGVIRFDNLDGDFSVTSPTPFTVIGTGHTLQLTRGNETTSLTLDVKSICHWSFHGGKGADTIDLRAFTAQWVTGCPAHEAGAFSTNLGNGDNTVYGPRLASAMFLMDVRAGSGDDFVKTYGGTSVGADLGGGDNRFYGGPEPDIAFTGAGNDVLLLGAGTGWVHDYGGATSTIVTGSKNDVIRAHATNTYIRSGAGRDNVEARGRDIHHLNVNTGRGKDKLWIDPTYPWYRINCGPGIDHINFLIPRRHSCEQTYKST